MASRRELLQVGFSAYLGAGLPALLAARAAAADAPAGATANVDTPRAKSVLLVFLTGACSHIDTFDMKPDAPSEIRGDFSPIATNEPGIAICEHLPKLAQQLDKLAIVRSMNTAPNLASHETGTHAILTGNNSLPPGSGLYASRNDWPCYAAAVDAFAKRDEGVPAGVMLPLHLAVSGAGYCGQNAGFLGAGRDPWQLHNNPNDLTFAGDAALTLPDGLSISRLNDRRALLHEVDRQRNGLDRQRASADLSQHQAQAYDLLESGRLARAFSLADEAPSVRDRYGRTLFGQSLLLARRVLEAGVPLVQANMGVAGQWDTHVNNFNGLKNNLLPPFDRALAALLDDLAATGLLEETLVIVTGEFGRTPKIGGNVGTPSYAPDGRDHWTHCFSTLFAGAGVRGGQTVGASDKHATFPVTQPYWPADLGATIFTALGVPPQAEIQDQLGRPLLLNQGQPMNAVFRS